VLDTKELICLREVTVLHESKVVVHPLDLKFHEGEKVAFLGKSGAGKSSVLNLMAGIRPPSQGEIEMLGLKAHSRRHQVSPRVRRNIGLMQQDFELLDEASLLANVLFGLLPKKRLPRFGLFGYSGAEILLAKNIVDSIALDQDPDTPAKFLSGGERSRVALARALIGRPKIVILDEPISSLDEQTSSLVMKAISKYSQANSLALVSMHNITLALDWASRVIVLKDGHLVLDKPSQIVGKSDIELALE
jgi:phosphonate transport system ATP-binding protein